MVPALKKKVHKDKKQFRDFFNFNIFLRNLLILQLPNNLWMKGDKVKGKKVVLGLKIFPETNDEKFWFNVTVRGYL